ncbi:MAG: NAD metabolism ATPase/kinase [Cytophagaceae bacterium]|nr:NAD metabolism ATPase/kinase [Cytophagaceae bacterium]
MNFTQQDIDQLEAHGLSLDSAQQQLETFKNGIPFVRLVKPATIGDGICKYNSEDTQAYIALFETRKDTLDLLKFTPASGAATRMFKFLFEFLKAYDPEQQSINSYINKNQANELRLFFVGLDDFPFYREIRDAIKPMIDEASDVNSNRLLFVKTMLGADGFDYGNHPKGLFPFHKYKDHNASAFEEHLFEASLYAKTKGLARLHFTISKTHYDSFQNEFERIQHIVEAKTNTQFDISYSFQSRTTDTLAVGLDNEPFRVSGTKNLLLRPGGHGALIQNLNDQEADIIFIKNIDNVVTVAYEQQVAHYKKLLAGKLLQLQERAFYFLKLMDARSLSSDEIEAVINFLQSEFHVAISSDFDKFSKENKEAALRAQLDRPIRVCGMVKNEGEPGGGPFWVKHEDGHTRLEIIESVQIDQQNKNQKAILNASTHFNPVDIVCGVKDYKGNKYNLLDFVDTNAGFITKKTVEGKPIKALEHPGLWNGSMAFWNTIFVEVPLITFNPVKTVNDLLKPTHKVKSKK